MFLFAYSPRVTDYESNEIQLVTKNRCCDGWTGDTCDQALCTPACQNFGRCAAPNRCECDQTKWTGPSCEQGISIVNDILLNLANVLVRLLVTTVAWLLVSRVCRMSTWLFQGIVI